MHSDNSPSPPCLLSFDVEEYFHIEAARSAVDRRSWPSYLTRVEPIVDWLLEQLAAHAATATFFTLGWVAERHPSMIRRIADAGHEIACHGYGHDRLCRLDRRAFADDLSRAKHVLEQASGQRVIGYRAPTFSLVPATAWAVDVLIEQGFVYDSSVQPIRHPQYGVPGAPRWPYQLAGADGTRLVELPPLSWQIGSLRLPVAGGGYFRLFPLRFMLAGIRQAHRAGQPAMLYFHPWEFDPDQPRLPLTGVSRWRTYVGLSRTRRRLSHLLYPPPHDQRPPMADPTEVRLVVIVCTNRQFPASDRARRC
ncbi:MAG: DUF3473 domain-containing protein [Phycisphaeraceae bacterium]|nr:DUF3473 domain-containing protein [Phycisphaeraceae bacterium]